MPDQVIGIILGLLLLAVYFGVLYLRFRIRRSRVARAQQRRRAAQEQVQPPPREEPQERPQDHGGQEPSPPVPPRPCHYFVRGLTEVQTTVLTQAGVNFTSTTSPDGEPGIQFDEALLEPVLQSLRAKVLDTFSLPQADGYEVVLTSVRQIVQGFFCKILVAFFLVFCVFTYLPFVLLGNTVLPAHDS